MTPTEPPRYRVHPSPIGDVLIVVTDDGIVTLHPFDGPLHGEIERVALQLHALPVPDEDADAAASPSPGTAAAVFEAAQSQLDEYFAGERRAFDLPLDWRLVRGGFARAALQAVCDIPYGETAGYGEVAIAAGIARAARAVGTACATTPFSIVVPVHRVVRADGSLGEYGGRPDVKRYLIDLEQGPSIPPAPAGAREARTAGV
ncbi:methylated-DNA--[protein]-cysteine S-methyltransferase [Microbacterium sp. NEAU-LLC]|uniref:Methylated-DNA--[protein]-cysteine S-methyltransferase n=1 Tax=Microbacterium helvum TaxID=2773713 RepID=A0ABR8NPE6_9MICO|nr:methylated-DNA--[protein]-cysteine S-methyltransferase [Microbacterium helvum]MBD3942525.1 methylated-DNA--[protein]-cysteine S-methyltransferase [Microbacterium helvum]